MSRIIAAGGLFVAVLLAGCARTPPATAGDHPGLQALELERNEGWLGRELRRFQTYPHLDRAFRLMSTGALLEAKTELERYLTLDPRDLQVRFHYLVLLHRLQEHPLVIREADMLLRDRPGFAPARLYRALASHARADGAAALGDFQAVAATDGVGEESQALALTMVVDLGLAQRQADVALDAADRLVLLRPGIDSQLRRGRALHAMGRLAEADTAFRTALADARSLEERMRVREVSATLAEQRRDWQRTQAELLALLEADPRNPSLLRRLGEVAHARGDLRESARWFRASAAVTGDAQDRERVGNALYAAADYQGGTQEFRQLVTQATTVEDRHRILLALGHGYLKLGRLADAAQAFRQAAQLKPDVATVTALADALQRDGRPAEAAVVLEDVVARDASGETHLKLATLYAKLRRWDRALGHLAAATAADATGFVKAEAYKQQGFIYYALTRYGEARRAFERSVEYNGRDVAVYMALGETCMKLDAFEDAVTYLKRALALTEDRAAR